jgi:hypothetical protein
VTHVTGSIIFGENSTNMHSEFFGFDQNENFLSQILHVFTAKGSFAETTGILSLTAWRNRTHAILLPLLYSCNGLQNRP